MIRIAALASMARIRSLVSLVTEQRPIGRTNFSAT